MIFEDWQYLVLLAFAVENLVLLLCFSVLFLRRKRRLKRRAREAAKRKAQFTLPEKNNSYVRMRLGTALAPIAMADGKKGSANVAERPDFTHARKLLQRLETVPLTTAERLRAESLSAKFVAYENKETWNANDVLAANDALLTLLKICGKYAV